MDFGIRSGGYGYGTSRYDGWGQNGNGVTGYEAEDSKGAYGADVSGMEPDEETAPEDDEEKIGGRKSSPAECETCKNRKYQDGSDEMVSFKAAGHMDPGNAAAVVMSHEQEHVSNAYQKADANNGEVVRASVRLKTDVCPECGRTYISGGETTTQIRYYNESNPYQKDLKESDADNKYRGANVDIAA